MKAKALRALALVAAPFLLFACKDEPPAPSPTPSATVSAAPVEEFVVLRKDQTLSGVAGPKWRQVCRYNQEVYKTLPDCHKLQIGTVIRFPVGFKPAVKADGTLVKGAPVPQPSATPRAKPSAAAKAVATQPKTKPKAKAEAPAAKAARQKPKAKAKAKARQAFTCRGRPPVKVRRNSRGYFEWKKVGIRNMRIYAGASGLRDSQRCAMEQNGLSDAEIDEVFAALDSGKAEEGVMEKGMRHESVSFSTSEGVFTIEKVEYTGDKSHRIWRIRLSTGRVVTIVEECDNVVVEEAPPPPPLPPAPPPPPEAVPPPPPPAPPLPVPAPPVEQDKSCLEPKGVVGAEYNLNNVGSVFLDTAGYCMWEVEGGRDGLGIGVKGSAYYGNNKNGPGHFDGHLAGIGGAFRQQRDVGTDTEYKVLMMDLRGKYRETDYIFKRNHQGPGFSFARSDYRRRLKGHKDFNENQQYAFCFVPVAGGSRHSWQGQALADPSKLRFLCHAGGRLYLYEFKSGSVYLQAGVLGEFAKPTDIVTGSVRVGWANKHRYFGAGVGFDYTIIGRGGVVLAGGIWYDPFLHITTNRAKARANLREDLPDDGSVRFPDQPLGQDLLAEPPASQGVAAAPGPEAEAVPFTMVPTDASAPQPANDNGGPVAANDNPLTDPPVAERVQAGAAP